MAQTLRNTVVNRHENLHYVKFDGVSKPVLAGTGLTDWTQAVDPSTDDGQYINEKTSHSNMMAYTPSVSYSGELIPNNEFVRQYEIQPSNPGSGEGGGKIALEGTFAQKGASEHGQYNVATGEFTAGEYDYTTGKFTAASPQSGASSTPAGK